MHNQTLIGACYGLGAFLIWGLFPLYWKALQSVNALESLAHRMLWTVLVVLLVLIVIRRVRAAWRVLCDPRQAGVLVLSAILISLNWGIYIWAVINDRVIETSLGYFLTPLINVLFGLLFFAERLRPWQWVAVALAAAGMCNQILLVGVFPWVALSLGFSFAAYGAIRKKSSSDAVTGLFVEASVLAPFALGYLLWLNSQGQMAFLHSDLTTDLLLFGCGVITAVPLLCYVAAAKRLRMASLGLMTYIAPSLQFSLGAFWYDEPLLDGTLLTFALIWSGLLLYTLENRLKALRLRPEAL